MALIRVLDELIVALGADVFLHLHATPVAWLFALGIVVVGVVAVAARAILVVAGTGGPAPSAVSRHGHREPRLRSARTATVRVGAQGPRAPGARAPRPATLR